MSAPGVAILGYGAIAELHAAALASVGARLVSVAGPNGLAASAFAARHGIECWTTDVVRAISMDGVEVVIVASPSTLHPEHATTALGLGRDVLVEIPLALALPDAERVIDYAARVGRRVGVCQTLEYFETVRVMRDTMATVGGKVNLIAAQLFMRRVSDTGWTGRARSWTDSLLWHHGGHVIHLVLSLLGATDAHVWAFAGGSGLDGSPTRYSIGLKLLDGALAAIALSYESTWGAFDVTAVGLEHSFLLTRSESRVDDRVLCSGDPDQLHAAAVLAQDVAFLDAIRTGAPFASEATAVLPTIRVQQEISERSKP